MGIGTTAAAAGTVPSVSRWGCLSMAWILGSRAVDANDRVLRWSCGKRVSGARAEFCERQAALEDVQPMETALVDFIVGGPRASVSRGPAPAPGRPFARWGPAAAHGQCSAMSGDIPIPSLPRPVLIAGGGIGGMATALTLHQIGVPCIVFETVPELQPLGVGINLQPNAERELHDLGFGNDVLDTIGLQAREWALVGRNGNEVYAEPRGLAAGYRWPQYSVHRGQLQMLLFDAVRARLGDDAVRLGQRVTGYRQDADGVTALIETRDGRREEVAGSLLIAADGLHSAVRAQMHPTQPPIQWGGAIMWRGTTPGVPVRTGASFVGVGSLKHRVVLYPISPPDPATGSAGRSGGSGWTSSRYSMIAIDCEKRSPSSSSRGTRRSAERLAKGPVLCSPRAMCTGM